MLSPAGRDPVTVEVEIARTGAETRRGLMYRESLPPDVGMLFLFPRPHQISFWMRNTLISLDMIFITSELRVLGVVADATPRSDEPREVEGNSQYVLEVNAGFAASRGIVAGTPVRFENVPRMPRVTRLSDHGHAVIEEWED